MEWLFIELIVQVNKSIFVSVTSVKAEICVLQNFPIPSKDVYLCNSSCCSAKFKLPLHLSSLILSKIGFSIFRLLQLPTKIHIFFIFI